MFSRGAHIVKTQECLNIFIVFGKQMDKTVSRKNS